MEVASYGYEAGGNLALVTGQSVNYAGYLLYNALGQPGTLGNGNNVGTTYQYTTNNNRLLRMTTGAYIDLTYNYDYSGNVTKITNNLDSTKTQTFTYDDLSRLTQAQSTSYGTTYSYGYDEIGNLWLKEGIGYDQYGLNAGPHAVTHTSDGKSTPTTRTERMGSGTYGVRLKD
jgi:YD repeat-containing protein